MILGHSADIKTFAKIFNLPTYRNTTASDHWPSSEICTPKQNFTHPNFCLAFFPVNGKAVFLSDQEQHNKTDGQKALCTVSINGLKDKQKCNVNICTIWKQTACFVPSVKVSQYISCFFS